MAPHTMTLPLDQAARLLHVSATELARRFPGLQELDAASFDLLTNNPPYWLLEARADLLLVSVVQQIDDELAAALGRTEEVLERTAAATLSNHEVASLLDLPVDVVSVFEPRRGWSADDVADLLRQNPKWIESPTAARDHARKRTQREHAKEARRVAGLAAKARLRDQNRSRWAEIAGVSIDEVPESFTKIPTKAAIDRFLANPPRWAKT